MPFMQEFVYSASAARVIYGSGSIRRLPEEVARLHLNAPLILSTPNQEEHADAVSRILNDKIAGVFPHAEMHTPTEVTDKAVSYAEQVNADSVISIGGGSTIGLGKAISIRTRLPHICIPTTYAGSEMTGILGETKDGVKTTRTDPKIVPGTVIYDVDFTMTLPARLSATSGINAIAHAVEALYSHTGNPIISLLALEGIKALVDSLPNIMQHPDDLNTRLKLQYGAWLCSMSLSSVGMSLHHKLCHTLGGSFNLPHAETHAIMLPHSLAYNAPMIPVVMAQLADVFPESGGDAVRGLNILLAKLHLTEGLKTYGFRETDVDKAADLAVLKSYPNPRPVQRDLIREVIRRAYMGEKARSDL